MQNIHSSPSLVWPGKEAERTLEPRTLAILEHHQGHSFAPGNFQKTATPKKAETGQSIGSSKLWHNLLVHADNRHFLSSLIEGPLQKHVASSGGIKLVYADPPFAVGCDFTMTLGRPLDSEKTDAGEYLKAVAYSDNWVGGINGFLDMMYSRLLLVHRALAPDGSFILHCDWRTAPYMRLILDEIFGSENFLGDIVWHYTGGGRATRWFSRKHDRLLHYAVSDRWTFNLDAIRVPYKTSSGYAKGGITSRTGKHYSPDPRGTPVDDVWDFPIINPLSKERNGYPTQKPETLLERIILATSNPGDIIADFFCGSGTTVAVAERLQRRWIAVDNSAHAVHATRKRILDLHSHTSFLFADMQGKPDSSLVKHDPVFEHTAKLSGGLLRYRVIDLSFTHTRTSKDIFFTLEGFTIEEVSFAVAGQGLDSQARRAQKIALQTIEAVRSRLSNTAQKGLSLLDYWSVGLLISKDRYHEEFAKNYGPDLAAITMEDEILSNVILWSSHRNKDKTPLNIAQFALPLPQKAGFWPIRIVVTLVDCFSNASRLCLSL